MTDKEFDIAVEKDPLYKIITGYTATRILRNLRTLLLFTMPLVILKHYNILIHSWFWAFSWLWIDPCLCELRLIYHDHLRTKQQIKQQMGVSI